MPLNVIAVRQESEDRPLASPREVFLGEVAQLKEAAGWGANASAGSIIVQVLREVAGDAHLTLDKVLEIAQKVLRAEGSPTAQRIARALPLVLVLWRAR